MSDRNEALRLADALQMQVKTRRLAMEDDSATGDIEMSAQHLRRLTAEQAVMRQWIADVLPVLASIDDCEDMEPIRALLESGRKLVDGGPDDLLKGVE